MSCENIVNIEIYKNKTKTWEIQFEENNAALNIEDFKIYFIVKTKKSDLDSAALLNIEITNHSDAVNGKTEIHLTKAQTNALSLGNYWYSVEFNDGETGADEDEDVLYEGRLTVLRPTRIGS